MSINHDHDQCLNKEEVETIYDNQWEFTTWAVCWEHGPKGVEFISRERTVDWDELDFDLDLLSDNDMPFFAKRVPAVWIDVRHPFYTTLTAALKHNSRISAEAVNDGLIHGDAWYEQVMDMRDMLNACLEEPF